MPSERRSRSRSREPRHHRDRSPDRRDRERRRSASPRHQRHNSRSRSRSRSKERDLQRDRSTSRDRDREREKRRRSHSRSRSAERKPRDKDRTRRRSRSRKRSASVSSSGSDSEREARRKRKKEKHKRRSSRSRERKERKREKKERKKKKSGATGSHWGKHGLLTESDLYNKAPEFHAWLVEERMVNPETMTKDQSKKEFARFIEDFNTATLPNDKYYNIEVYERRMSALRSGEFLPPTDDGYDPNADMRALQSQHRRRDVDRDSYLSREQLEELRKVQNERTQMGKMKAMGMEIKQNMGVRMDGTSFDD